MSYELKHSESLQEGIARIACAEIDDAVERLTKKRNDLVETVHEARKDVKKLRALLRLVRPGLRTKTYRYENEFFRDIGHQLSDARDAQIMIESVDKLTSESKANGNGRHNGKRGNHRQELQEVRAHLEEQRDGINAMLKAKGVFDALITSFKEARERVEDWAAAASGWEIIEDGLGRSYERGRDAFELAYKKPTFTNFHDWRKRVKDLHYQARLLRSLWPDALTKLSDDISTLGDLLGDDHDFGVLERLLEELNPELAPSIARAIEARRKELRAKAKPLGECVYDEKPKRFLNHFAALWHAW